MQRFREAGDVVDVIITPEPGQHKAIAQLLLSVADTPYQVRSVMTPAQGFEVPEALFDKFEAVYKPEQQSDDTSDVSRETEGTPQETVTAAPKKRGRPRKKQGEEE